MSVEDSAAGGMTHRSQPRAWVLVAGGLMALGWVLLVMALLTGQIGAALTFLFLIMLPVNIWWRYMLRRQQKAADPEVYAAERKAARQDKLRRNVAIAGWGAKHMAAKIRHQNQLDRDLMRPRRKGDPDASTIILFGEEAAGVPEHKRKPKLGAPPGSGEMAEEAGVRFGSILRAFVTPMPAAVAEWKASR